MFEDGQRAVDVDGSVLNERFAVAVNEFDEVVTLVGNHTYRVLVPFQCLYLKYLNVKNTLRILVLINLPKYSLVAAAAIAISSSKLLGLQLVVFQWVRNPDALMYFLSQP